MNVTVRLEIHAYAENALCDRVFDEPPFYGINGPEIMRPLSEKRGHVFCLKYDKDTRVGDIIDAVKQVVWGNDGEPAWSPTLYSFLHNNERYYIINRSQNFDELLLKFLDPDRTGHITVCILVSCDAGDVRSEGPLRFYVHSRESGSHNEAHIHVCDVGRRYEASVRISDGEIIAGALPRKLAKLAKKKILSDQEYFYNCWNTLTDGLKVDINHHYGYIQY